MMKMRPGWNRCEVCGKYIAVDDVVIREYIPDTHFTVEKISYICLDCLAKEMAKETIAKAEEAE